MHRIFVLTKKAIIVMENQKIDVGTKVNYDDIIHLACFIGRTGFVDYINELMTDAIKTKP